jgi:integrin beta 3
LYIGKVSCTRGGIDCQVWNLISGGQMPTTPDKYTNYCRDPDNTGKPWCYTTVPGVRWDYCHVPEC